MTLNEYASNFESLNGNKHHVPDTFFEIVSQFFYSFFFSFLLFSAVETKNRNISAKVVNQSGTCTWSKIKIKIENSLGLMVIRITQF